MRRSFCPPAPAAYSSRGTWRIFRCLSSQVLVGMHRSIKARSWPKPRAGRSTTCSWPKRCWFRAFADWELMRQGLRLEPLLQAISDFLDDQKDMIEQVRCDLTRGLKNAETGRSGLTPQQILRSLVLMRIKNWDYRELRERIADGCTLRQFTDFYCLPVPRHDAFHRGFNRLTPETLKAINDLVVQAAVGLGLEDGQKLRVDTTVVQTDIHHPTDNTLLWDAVRVVTRLIGRLATALGRRRIKGFCDRTCAARRRMLAIQRMTTTQRHHQQSGKYRELIGITEQDVESARSVVEMSSN